MRRLFAAFALFAMATPAMAQSLNTVVTDYSATLTTTPTNCVPADKTIKTLIINNVSAGNIGYCYRLAATPATPCTPAIGSAGTYTIPNGVAPFLWPYGSAPTNGLDCIGASSNVVGIAVGR
jgi:hypothetical protein